MYIFTVKRTAPGTREHHYSLVMTKSPKNVGESRTPRERINLFVRSSSARNRSAHSRTFLFLDRESARTHTTVGYVFPLYT